MGPVTIPTVSLLIRTHSDKESISTTTTPTTRLLHSLHAYANSSSIVKTNYYFLSYTVLTKNSNLQNYNFCSYVKPKPTIQLLIQPCQHTISIDAETQPQLNIITKFNMSGCYFIDMVDRNVCKCATQSYPRKIKESLKVPPLRCTIKCILYVLIVSQSLNPIHTRFCAYQPLEFQTNISLPLSPLIGNITINCKHKKNRVKKKNNKLAS